MLWKIEHLLKGANAKFSITFSNTKYFKGVKRRLHEVKQATKIPLVHS